jgi:hypothetical protein
VGWIGGARWGLSVNAGAPVYGWVPLGWGEPFHPWWGHCSYNCWATYNRPYAVNVATRPANPPSHFRNSDFPNAVTAVSGATLQRRLPVASNRVTVPTHLMANAPVLAAAPAVAAGPLRVPGTRAGTAGTPPPASTFYPMTRSGRPTPQPLSRPVEAAAPASAPAQSMARPGGAATQAPAVSPAPFTRPAPAAPSPVANAPVTTNGPARTDARTDLTSRKPPSPPAQTASVPVPPAQSSSAQPYTAPLARPAPTRPPASERIGAMPPAPAAHPMPPPALAPNAQVPMQHPQAVQGPALVRPEGRAEHANPPKPVPAKPEPVPGVPAKP